MQDVIALIILTSKQCQHRTIANVRALPDGHMYVTQFGDRSTGVFVHRLIHAAADGQ